RSPCWTPSALSRSRAQSVPRSTRKNRSVASHPGPRANRTAKETRPKPRRTTMTPSDVSAKRLLTEGIQAVRERIAARAYDIYVERERGDGEDRALDDWLRAESEILA